MEAQQLQQGTVFCSATDLKESLDRLSWSTESKGVTAQGYSHPTTLGRKSWAADPMGALLMGCRAHRATAVGKGEGTKLPSQELLAAL